MQKRRIGSTDIQVSVIGLGTVKFGRNQGVKYPAAFTLPSDAEVADLLAIAADAGINLLDTAPAYGSSEERLGKLLKNQRANWVIATKVGEEFVNGESTFDFSPQTVRASVDRSLQRLKTDYLDVVLGHSNGDDMRIIQQDELFETLAALKREGKLRAYGMSTKTMEGGLATIAHADIAMVTYNQQEQQDKVVIAAAHKNQKSIFIKKALASGHLKTTPAEALQFVLTEPGVTSVIIGTINPAHLRDNVNAISNSTHNERCGHSQ